MAHGDAVILPIRTAFRNPWQDGIAERWVGSIRRDLLDHVVVLNQRHLAPLMGSVVYAADLDLFGRGSLFELLSTARTRMGEETLANWLLAPAMTSEITERHAAVRELGEQLNLSEDIAVLGQDASVAVHPEALRRWAQAPSRMKPEWVRWLSLTLSILAITGVVIWIWSHCLLYFGRAGGHVLHGSNRCSPG